MNCILITGYCESPFVIGASSMIPTKTLLTPFLYPFLVFLLSVSRRVVMRVRRHVIINANTQFYCMLFILSSVSGKAGTGKRKGNLVGHRIYVGGNDVR